MPHTFSCGTLAATTKSAGAAATARRVASIGGTDVNHPNPTAPKLTESDVVEMRCRYAGGESSMKLAAAFGVSDVAARNAIAGRTYSRLPNAQTIRSLRESHVGGGPLGDDAVADIRRRAAAGDSYAAIADDMALGHGTVGNIARGKYYAHLPGAVGRRISPFRPDGLSLQELGAWCLQQVKPRPAPSGEHYAALEGDCLIWQRGRTTGGYGLVGKGRERYAHRLSLAAACGLTKGQRASIEVVEHACDVRACIQPAHLLASTHAANHRNATIRGRRARKGA